LFQKIGLTEIQLWGRDTRKTKKNFSLSVLSWLEAWITFTLRNILEFLSPWRSLSRTVLLVAIFHFAAYAKSREQCRLRQLLRSRVVKHMFLHFCTKHVLET